MDPTPQFSVIIPAHNEATVIARCLQALTGSAGTAEIVVVCNGCTDDTVAVARMAAPGATVLDLAQGSKILALNAGNAAASAVPRFFVDADVVVSGDALASVAQVLAQDGEIKAAAPALDVDLTGCSWPVRAYYHVWMRQPYVREGMVGSGVFGLSASGLAAVGEFPDVIADDLYVRTRFALEQRARVAQDEAGNPVSFKIFPPRDLKSLIRIEARRRAGDMQLADTAHSTQHCARTTTGGTLLGSLGRDVGPLDLACYLMIKTAGRMWARRMVASKKAIEWKRDESSR